MRVKDFVGATKADVTCGQWQTGRMPKSLFPLGKSGKHYLDFRGGYEWCLVECSALEHAFKLLIVVDYEKRQYYAFLGMVFDKDTRMLASLEYHGTHPGWHLHAGCGDVDAIPVGRYMGPWRRRIPRDPQARRKPEWMEWDVTRDNALATACEAFGIPPPPIQEQGGQMKLV